MKKMTYYHDLLGGIFHVLDRFSKFRIGYKTVARMDDSGDSFVFESVNRISDPDVFEGFIDTLLSEIRLELIAQVKLLSYRELSSLMDEVVERYKSLRKLVLLPGRIHGSEIRSIPDCWDTFLFDPRNVYSDDASEEPDNVPISVLIQANLFAGIWVEQMENAALRALAIKDALWLREESSFMLSSALPLPLAPKESPAFPKIPLHCSVHRLGFHIRLLYEEGVFLNITKSELCRLITKCFRTENQEEISVRSLRNAMDSPKEHAVRYFMEKWKEYLEKAENFMFIN